MAQKKGMEFFKSYAAKPKPSILAGMRIVKSTKDATKESKPIAQSQTHFSQKIQELPASKDDHTIKKKSTHEYSPPLEHKDEEPLFKKNKLSENINSAEKKSPVSKVSHRMSEEEVKNEMEVKGGIDKRFEDGDSKSNKSSLFSSQQGTLASEPVPMAQIKRKVQVDYQGEKKMKVEKKKQDEPFSVANRKGSATLESKKAKKSDREQILDEINDFTVKLVGIIIYQKEIKLQASQSKAIIAEMRNDVARWTSEQTVCAERQEYDEAERLQSHILESQKKIEELDIQLGYMEEQVIKQEHQEISLLKIQNSNMKRLGRRLKLVELQLQDDAANIKRDQMQKIEALRTKQDAERKKIQRIEKDIGYQGQQISQFQKEFRQELDSKMDPLLAQQASLEKSKATLEEEIRQLQKKLKEKKVNLAHLTKQLKQVGENLSETKSIFKEQSDKLQERKNKLQVVENERDEMQLTINDLECNIEMQTSNMDQKVEQKELEARELAVLAKSIQQGQISFDDEIEARRATLDSFLINAQYLKEFESKHRAQKQKLKELEYKKSTVSAEIVKLQERREELKKKVPVLELQQKKFADLKNFKAAGIKKSEIREINEELDNIKVRLDGYLGEEHGLELQYEDTVNTQTEANQEEQALQKNLAFSQIKFDLQKVTKLEAYQAELSRMAKGSVKDRDKMEKELDQEIERIKEEIKHLSVHHEISLSPQKQSHEEEPQQQQLDQKQLGQGSEGVQEEQQRAYQPLSIPQPQPSEELQENSEEDGYVPLELD